MFSVRLTWVRLLSLCLILPAMSGCATVSTAPVNSYCAIAQPLGYDSIKDSPETVAAIELHNSKWVCLCELECPAGIAP